MVDIVNYVVSTPPAVTVPVSGSEKLFPVRRIYCVGRNYAAHAIEMGGDERDPPFFFQKPTDSIVLNGSDVAYPMMTTDFQFEVELVLAIAAGGNHIDSALAEKYVFGLATGIDFTRRDLQATVRSAGRPWEVGKSFDESAAISDITPLNGTTLPTSGSIRLAVNGETNQSGDLSEMIWNCADIVATLSTYYRLEAGDLIFTGTPAGVGPVLPGDKIYASIDGQSDLKINIVEKQNDLNET